MRAGVPLWALLIVAVLCACARNPVSGRPEVVLVSKQAEVGLGEKAAKEVEATMGLVPDEALQAYVQQIGARLAKESPRQDVEYHVAVVDMAEPNAFALPGGYVYVSRGLLATAIREDELAAVIGHEIGHVAGRHTVQQVTTATPIAIVLGLPAAIVGTVSKSLGSILAFPGRVTSGLVLARRGRNQEREADRTGMQMSAKAGWDPHALADILARMERLGELSRDGKGKKASYFDSHPTTAERVGNVDAFAAGLESADVPSIAPGRNAFLQRLNGLLLADNPTAGVFAEQTFLHPELGFEIEFPADWKRQNHPTHVLAVKPESKGRTFAMLQISSKGEDPVEGARADGLHKRLLDQLRSSEIHGLPAVVLETEERGSVYHITWIAHRGSVYRISAVADTSDLASSGAILRGVAPTFRDLGPEGLERIRAHRLRNTAARSGETIDELYERSASTWTAAEGALYNDVPSDAALKAGQLIKVSKEEPYQPPR
ncbi:MAG: M48 family metalloprotease [Myxococcota bacterium]